MTSWSNADATKLPLFVREGAIVPLLRDTVSTLCDANYVNDPTVTTMNANLLFQIYPGSPIAVQFDTATGFLEVRFDHTGGTSTIQY